MNVRQKFTLLALSLLLALLTLACNLISQVAEPVSQVIDEAQQIATQVGEIATQVNFEELSATMEALATNMPVDLEGLQATAEAIQGGFSAEEVPADIPLVAAEINNLYASKDIVSYTTPQPYQEVVDFYKDQMPVNNWAAVQNGNIETSAAAVLNFEKTDRSVVVTLSSNPLNAETVVLITISAK